MLSATIFLLGRGLLIVLNLIWVDLLIALSTSLLARKTFTVHARCSLEARMPSLQVCFNLHWKKKKELVQSTGMIRERSERPRACSSDWLCDLYLVERARARDRLRNLIVFGGKNDVKVWHGCRDPPGGKYREEITTSRREEAKKGKTGGGRPSYVTLYVAERGKKLCLLLLSLVLRARLSKKPTPETPTHMVRTEALNPKGLACHSAKNA